MGGLCTNQLGVPLVLIGNSNLVNPTFQVKPVKPNNYSNHDIVPNHNFKLRKAL